MKIPADAPKISEMPRPPFAAAVAAAALKRQEKKEGETVSLGKENVSNVKVFWFMPFCLY